MSRALVLCVALTIIATAAFLLIRGGVSGGGLRETGKAGSQNGSEQAATAPTAPVPLEPLPFKQPSEPAPAPVAAQPAVRGMMPAGMLVSRRSSVSGRISGTWTLRDRAPAAGYPVLIYPVADDGSTLGQLYARTGTEGMYEVHVEPGRYMVAFGDARVPTEVSPRGHTLVDYAAPVSGAVTVRVPHDGGIANVLVSLVVISSRGAVHEMLSRTGPGGTARFAEVPEGKGEVTASVPKREGGTPIYATTKFDAPGEGSVEVELHMPSGALTLFVADTAGRPLAGVAVEVWSRLHRGSPDVRTTGAEGRVSFTNLVAGRTTVRASLPGYAPRIAEFRAEEGGMRHHLVLAHGRQVPVRVTLTTGEPMQIVLRALAIRDAQPGRMWESRTGEDGSGVLEDLPAESILLRFVAAGCKEVLMELPANTPSAEVRFERVAK